MINNWYEIIRLSNPDANKKESGIYLELYDDYCLFFKNNPQFNFNDCVLQYLYITSDEEIKDKCVVYRTDTKTVHLSGASTKHMIGIENTGGVDAALCKKVIATNDPAFLSPTTPESILIDNTYVPGLVYPISQDFIDLYIDKHNSKKPISKVQIEVIKEPVFKPILVDNVGLAYDVTQHSERIEISIFEDKVFSRSEAKKIAHLAARKGYDNYNGNVRHEEDLIEKWFNKNYPE